MQEYRTYVIGSDEHIISRTDILCSDEDEAKQQAKQLVNGHAVELWQTDRLIGRFEPESARSGITG
jgi:hypothetical protein